MGNKILYSDSYNISDNEIYYQIAKIYTFCVWKKVCQLETYH